MLKCLECMNWKNLAVFAGGVLFGTAGIKVLGSQDAKKVYVNCTAGGLRAKECVMTAVSVIQENADDILAEAKEINEKRAQNEYCGEDDREDDGEEEVKENAASEEKSEA